MLPSAPACGRLQIQQYTQQLAKDTNRQLRELVAPKLVKDKLTNEFSEALRNFQLVQRAEADKEKDSVKRARAASGLAVRPRPPVPLHPRTYPIRTNTHFTKKSLHKSCIVATRVTNVSR